MDKVLKNANHINWLCKSSYAQLQDILKIRSSLDATTAQVIVQALVLSKLDYCNSLLTGMANYQIKKLQCIQNMTCRIITNLWKYDHITDSMKQLNWLRIKECIHYKLGLIMYKCKNNLAPEYLKELTPTNQNKRLLCSSTTGCIPPVFCKTSQIFKWHLPQWDQDYGIVFEIMSPHLDQWKPSNAGWRHIYSTHHIAKIMGWNIHPNNILK